MAESLANARGQAEQTIEQATRNSEQGRFVDAIRMMEGMQLANHTGLDDLRDLVKERSEDFARRREEVASSAGAVLEEVKELVEQGSTREAFERAKGIPPTLRGLELRALYDELETKVEEMTRLRQQVQEGLAKKDYAGIFAPAKRLAEVDPGDAKISKLVEKLESQREKLDRAEARKRLKSALAALKKCDYRAAEAAIDQVPDSDFDEKTRQALSGAKERVWLAQQLARAPFANESLVSIADRLVKLQSQDEKVAKLRVEVTRRWKEGLRKHAGKPVEWNKSSSAEGLVIAPTESSGPLAKHLAKKGYASGQFMIAYGLALQAAGRASLNVDLTPKRRGWARLLPGRGRKKGDQIAWGVDIGSHSVKAIKLVVPVEGDIAIDSVFLIPTRSGEEKAASSSEPRSKESSVPPASAAAVRKLLEEQDFTGAHVATGISGTLTLGRFFKLPWLSASKFEEAIRYEARMRIPLDPEDVQFDYTEQEVSASRPEEKGGERDGENEDAKVMRVALVGATRTHVDERLGLFSDSGAASVVLTGDGVALANAYYAVAGDAAESNEPVAVIDIGAKTTNVAILFQQGCWFRGSYFGGETFDQEMVKHFQCGWQKAEELRRKPSKATWMHEIDEALQPSFEAVAELIERTLSQFRNEEGRAVERVLICGGGGEQYGLLRFLRAGE